MYTLITSYSPHLPCLTLVEAKERAQMRKASPIPSCKPVPSASLGKELDEGSPELTGPKERQA